MISAEHKAGRIVEAHATGDVTYDEFLAFRSAFQGKFAKLPLGQKAIVVGDLRGTNALGPEVAPVVLGMLRADNARVERAAHLVTAGSGFHKQYESIVEATKNPNRQVFTDPGSLIAWLAPMLSEPELARLREMLGA